MRDSGKLLIVSAHDGALPYADISERSWADYAERWGYGFELHRFSTNRAAHGHPSWQKLPLLRSLMCPRAAEWIMWVDADTVVTNHAFPLSDVLESVEFTQDWLIEVRKKAPPDRAWLLVSRDWARDDNSPWSAGVMLWRPCVEALEFLDAALAGIEFRNQPLWDQSALQAIERPKGVFILPRRILQSAVQDGCSEPWQRGDFVAHVTGHEQCDKRQIMAMCDRMAVR